MELVGFEGRLFGFSVICDMWLRVWIEWIKRGMKGYFMRWGGVKRHDVYPGQIKIFGILDVVTCHLCLPGTTNDVHTGSAGGYCLIDINGASSVTLNGVIIYDEHNSSSKIDRGTWSYLISCNPIFSTVPPIKPQLKFWQCRVIRP